MAMLWRAKGTQFFDNSGNPLNGGKLAYFDAGTTSAKTVYQDSDEQTAWGSIVLDSSGRLEYSVYIGAGAFKERLRTSADVDIYTEDDIPGETVLTVDTFARPNMPVLSKSLSYTVLQDDIGSMVQADPTGGDVTITLISAVTAGDGAQVGIQHVGTAGKVIVAVPGGQTVNGASTVTICRPRAGAVFTSNAGVWSGAVTSAPYGTLSKTTTYTVDVADFGKTIKADATGGAFTITLPAASDAGDGFEATVVKIDSSSNAVTIDGDGSETVNGGASITLDYQWHAATIRCDGSNWQIVAGYDAIPNGALAAMAESRIKGRVSSGSGVPEDLTPANVRTIIASDTSDTGKFLDDAGAYSYAEVVQTVYAESTTATAISATIPTDNTIPQITEGTEYLTASITPKVSTHRIRVRFSGTGTTGAALTAVVALFRDAVSNALQAVSLGDGVGSVTIPLNLSFEHSPGTTSAVTYRIRIGVSTSNMTVTPAIFGGVSRATLTLEEIVA